MDKRPNGIDTANNSKNNRILRWPAKYRYYSVGSKYHSQSKKASYYNGLNVHQLKPALSNNWICRIHFPVVSLSYWTETLNINSHFKFNTWSTIISAIAGVLWNHFLFSNSVFNLRESWGLIKLYHAWNKSRAFWCIFIVLLKFIPFYINPERDVQLWDLFFLHMNCRCSHPNPFQVFWIFPQELQRQYFESFQLHILSSFS